MPVSKDALLSEMYEECEWSEEIQTIQEGSYAAQLGQALEACPYEEPVLREAWRLGWKVEHGRECPVCQQWVPYGWLHGCR